MSSGEVGHPVRTCIWVGILTVHAVPKCHIQRQLFTLMLALFQHAVQRFESSSRSIMLLLPNVAQVYLRTVELS